VPRGGELAGLGTVGEHGPDLPSASARGFENDVAAIGSPAGTLVAGTSIRCQVDDLERGRLHNVNVVVAVGTPPTEGEDLTVGRPSGIDDVALVGEIEDGCVGAVGVHHVELGDATAVANEDDRLAGLGIPCG